MIPDIVLLKIFKHASKAQAWREKVTLCILILMLTALTLAYIVLLPMLLCPNQNDTYSPDDILDMQARQVSASTGSAPPVPVVLAYGMAYALDATRCAWPDDVLPSPTPDITSRLLAANANFSTEATRAIDLQLTAEMMKGCLLGYLGWSYNTVHMSGSTVSTNTTFPMPNLFVRSGKVYNTTRMLDVRCCTADVLADLVLDAQSEKHSPSDVHGMCLRIGFVGLVDQRNAGTCFVVHALLVGSTVFVMLIFLFKLITAMQFGSVKEPDVVRKGVIVFVACYTENEHALRKTLDAIVSQSGVLPQDMLMIFVCDGQVRGHGCANTTTEILSDILNMQDTGMEMTFEYDDILPEEETTASASFCESTDRHPDIEAGEPLPGDGNIRRNRAKVLSCLYSASMIPAMVISKTGYIGEKQASPHRTGNRGKRDSQILLFQFLNKMLLRRNTSYSSLEKEIHRHITTRLCVQDPAGLYEFLLMVDADTRVMPMALHRLLGYMIHDTQITGICGETEIENAGQSWVTMIQVYEYYISHHLNKAFESLFGSVTCLPGCFSLFRLVSFDKAAGTNRPDLAQCQEENTTCPSRKPQHRHIKREPTLYLVADVILSEFSMHTACTLHERNLLTLGEDRFLTTLCKKHFPESRLVFTPDAKCKTVVPHRWKVLLSQRRRWINSTVHNLFELHLLPQMCGVAFLSMRLVVVLDLIATLILPGTFCYLIWSVMSYFMLASAPYRLIAHHQADGYPALGVIMLVIIYGTQALLFLLKRQWQHLGWMTVYLLATPIYYCLFPLYAFWNFDDFSWGSTCRIDTRSNDGLSEPPRPGASSSNNSLNLAETTALQEPSSTE